MEIRKLVRLSSITLQLIIAVALLNAAQAQAPIKEGLIKERRFQRMLNKENVILLDVRTPDEYNTGHIPNARLIDVQQPGFRDSIQALDKSKTYLLYCRSGKRSQKAVNLMKENGFKSVYHLKGGITAWKGAKE